MGTAATSHPKWTAPPPRPQWTGDSLLSTGDVASVLGKSIRTLIRWRNEGKGPPAIVLDAGEGRGASGRRYFYRYRELQAWIDQQPRTR